MPTEGSGFAKKLDVIYWHIKSRLKVFNPIFFRGLKWETCAGGFLSLKYLKFSHVDLHERMASAEDFPSLEQLVLSGCLDLAEIPSALGGICTLQVIEVYRASNSLVHSSRQIQESQRSWGNNDFKVFIHHHFQYNIWL